MEELIRNRHSVRKYRDVPLKEDDIISINKILEGINKNDLSFKLMTNENVFNLILGYGFIKNCKNYIVLSGKDNDELEEKVGYYGELLVLKLLEIGINSCFVGGTYKKKKVNYDLPNNHKIVMVLAIGYGIDNGNKAKTKTFNEVSLTKDVPDWYKNGIDMVLLAPSAINQKKWKFEFVKPNFVRAISGGNHFPKVDLGIAKFHFEIGAKKENFKWIK